MDYVTKSVLFDSLYELISHGETNQTVVLDLLINNDIYY